MEKDTTNQEATIGGNIIHYSRLLLAGFGVLWGVLMCSQTLTSGLTIIYGPTGFRLDLASFFGMGFLVVLVSFYLFTEELEQYL